MMTRRGFFALPAVATAPMPAKRGLTVREIKERCGLKDADVLAMKDGVRYVIRIGGPLNPDMLVSLRENLNGWWPGQKFIICERDVEFLEIVE